MREVRLVVDASPLIGLAKIGRLGLLDVLAEGDRRGQAVNR
jgi:hypothetical protein